MSWVGLFNPRILQTIKTQPRLGFLCLRSMDLGQRKAGTRAEDESYVTVPWQVFYSRKNLNTGIHIVNVQSSVMTASKKPV
jgi:hypothetical protein